MFKLYSKGCENALRALSLIPPKASQDRISIKDLCAQVDIPEASTRKTMQLLVQKRFLKAVPGPGGGYTFQKDPSKTSMLSLIKAIDGQDTYDRCIMGLAHCDERNPCSMHDSWSRLKHNLLKEMRHKTLDQVIQSVLKSKSRRKSRTRKAGRS